jgi:hypothetical protein
VRLALDNHYSPTIARRLRELHFDVVAAVERGWDAEDDEPLLMLCVSERRTLLTNNVSDFVAISRRWHAEERSHSGLVFTSDASRPRHRDTIGRYVEALAALLKANPYDDAFLDRVHWL